MSNAIERFLDDLALEASKKLPAGEGIRLLDEVRVHLDEELCSRLEFGETPEQAARQAVLAFGSPTELVNGIRCLNLPAQGTWHSRPFLIASTLGTLLSSLIVSSAAAADSSSDWLGYLLFVDFVVFGALLMITAWHAKRIQFISLAVCFALAVLAAGVFGAHENVYTDANPWGMPRYRVTAWIGDLEQNRVKIREEVDRFDAAYDRFLSGSFKGVPTRASLERGTYLRFEPESNRTVALERWADATKGWYVDKVGSSQAITDQAQQLFDQANGPWINGFPAAVQQSVSLTVWWVGLLAFINGAVALLRLMVDLISKWARPKPKTTA